MAKTSTKKAPVHAHDEHESVRLVKQALADIRRGKMVILTDDEDRENEGDLVMAAEKVTPEAVNFMALHGRGLICLSMTAEQISQLNLPMMVHENTSPFGTAFTISIEAATGVSTGISAADRARTIQVAVAPGAKPGDLVRPGHIFPLRARDGGVLVRSGQTEGSVDLARMAGLHPSGVICEIMNPDGTMARRPELLKYAKKHKLTMLSVADIIRYRLMHDQLVRRVAQSDGAQFGGGDFRAFLYESQEDPGVHVAMVMGNVTTGKEPVLTRVHRACLAGDLLGGKICDCGTQLQTALARIREEGRGVFVYLHKNLPAALRLQCTHQFAADEGRHPVDTRLREFGIGAQILRDVGLKRLRLLTNNPRKIVGLESYGLELVEQVPLTAPGASNSGKKDARRKVAARRLG